MDVTAPVGPQPHLGPLLGEHEKLFGVYPRQPRSPEVTGQVAQGPRGPTAGIDPPSERHDHGRQVGGRLAVELYIFHAHPLGIWPLPSDAVAEQESSRPAVEASRAPRSILSVIGARTCARAAALRCQPSAASADPYGPPLCSVLCPSAIERLSRPPQSGFGPTTSQW